MVAKKVIDWDTVKAEYQAGQLSIREIARNNDVSHVTIVQRAKRLGWTRNLIDRVREEAVKKLISEDSDTTETRAIDEDSIVSQAANRLMTVIQLHRKDVAQQRVIAADLMAQLVANPTKTVMIGKGKDRHEAEIPLSITDVSGILRNIAQAAAKYIPLERQAYNADGKAPTGSESDPIHVKHSMDTSGLSKAAGVPIKDVTPKIPQLEAGKDS